MDKELIELEEEFWRANREGDGAYFDRMMRDDAMAVSIYGVMGKADAVALVSANRNPFFRTRISDPKVIKVSDDAALVTYRADWTALVDGREVDSKAYTTSVYAREDDGWRSVFFQQTAL